MTVPRWGLPTTSTARPAGTYVRLTPLERAERARLVLRLRDGLDGETPHTQAEIGERLGLSQDAVAKIEQAARAARASHSTPA